MSHLITYHRYLRFLPSGDVLSLLANEDADPKEVVHFLKPDLRMKVSTLFIGARIFGLLGINKGFMHGRWRLNGTSVHVSDLVNPYSHSGRYSFEMVLNLKSRPLGRYVYRLRLVLSHLA